VASVNLRRNNVGSSEINNREMSRSSLRIITRRTKLHKPAARRADGIRSASA